MSMYHKEPSESLERIFIDNLKKASILDDAATVKKLIESKEGVKEMLRKLEITPDNLNAAMHAFLELVERGIKFKRLLHDRTLKNRWKNLNKIYQTEK